MALQKVLPLMNKYQSYINSFKRIEGEKSTTCLTTYLSCLQNWTKRLWERIITGHFHSKA